MAWHNIGRAISFFLVSRASDLHLVGVFQNLYVFYKSVFYPIGDVLRPAVFLLLGTRMPSWWHELIVMYLLFGAATARTYAAYENIGRDDQRRKSISYYAGVVAAFVFSIFFVPIYAIWNAISDAR